MELGLPISPLCDRSVTCIPESQLGTQCMLDRLFIMSPFYYKTLEACLHQAS